MSHFISTYKKGKEGESFGLTTGISGLDVAINGLQKKMTIGLAAAPKVGKTTFCDFAFILSPYLEAVANNTVDNVEWIYFSYEIDRVSKEFKFASFFMNHDYDVSSFVFEGTTYPMNPEYLQGKMRHKRADGSYVQIKVTDEHEGMLRDIYNNRIVPLFGTYTMEGKLIKAGRILFFDERDNPTGLYKFMLHYARKNGTFLEEKYETLADDGVNKVTRSRITSYVPNNSKKMTIVITDHVRRLKRERGFSMKDNIDKWLEYATDIKNWCDFTFIHIVHSNRSLANPDRLRYAGQYIFPTGDDTKDSGNFAEECTILMTLFNPNDEKYNLDTHFDVKLADYPYYRSLHITESRNTDCPAHIQMNMYGGINTFDSINKT